MDVIIRLSVMFCVRIFLSNIAWLFFHLDIVSLVADDRMYNSFRMYVWCLTSQNGITGILAFIWCVVECKMSVGKRADPTFIPSAQARVGKRPILTSITAAKLG